MTQAPFRDPIVEALPPGRAPSHRDPQDERRCPACGQPLDFLHFDHAEIPLGGLLSHGLYSSTELIVLFALIGGGIGAIWLLGKVVGTALLLLAVPFAWRWQHHRETDRAVWRCAPCDRYWTGTRLRPWHPPKVSPGW
jgi:hypothetical protein